MIDKLFLVAIITGATVITYIAIIFPLVPFFQEMAQLGVNGSVHTSEMTGLEDALRSIVWTFILPTPAVVGILSIVMLLRRPEAPDFLKVSKRFQKNK